MPVIAATRLWLFALERPPVGCLLLANARRARRPSPDGAATERRHRAAIERRIAELHTSLKITPGEQKPFDDFAQVTRDNGKRMDDLVRKAAGRRRRTDAISQLRAPSTTWHRRMPRTCST